MISGKVSCILVGAGRGERLKKRVNKALVKINDLPLFYHTLKVFLGIKEIREVILVVRREDVVKVKKFLDKRDLIKKNTIIKLTPGGLRRQDSVKKGLEKVSLDTEYVLIHDIARPFIKRRLIKEMIKQVWELDGIILGKKAVSSLKEVVYRKGDVYVKKSLKREKIFEIYTPQIFKKKVILEAYRFFNRKEVFDDSELMEKLKNVQIKIFETQDFNFKITYSQDLDIAKKLL